MIQTKKLEILDAPKIFAELKECTPTIMVFSGLISKVQGLPLSPNEVVLFEFFKKQMMDGGISEPVWSLHSLLEMTGNEIKRSSLE